MAGEREIIIYLMIFVLLTKLGLNAWKEEKDNITNSLFHWLLIVPDNYTLRNKQIWKFLINLAPSSFCTIKQKQTNWWLTEIHLSLLKNKRRIYPRIEGILRKLVECTWPQPGLKNRTSYAIKTVCPSFSFCCAGPPDGLWGSHFSLQDLPRGWG